MRDSDLSVSFPANPRRKSINHATPNITLFRAISASTFA
jgi:hypothetical protein